MPKIIFRTVEFARALKQSVVVVLVLLASIVRGPSRQLGDDNRRRQAWSRLEPLTNPSSNRGSR